jgi:hypothetical protein
LSLNTDFEKQKKMKRIYFTLALISSLLYVNAQEEDGTFKNNDEFKTIFGGKSKGGYGGLGVGYTLIDDKSSVAFDARGGIILGHWFAMGAGGGAFVSPYEYNMAHSADINLTGGYGGLFVEFILFPKSPVHVSFPILAGLGGAAVSTRIEGNSSSEVSNYVEQTSIFTIIEPSAELEFNFTKFFRMAGFFSYRYSTDLEFDGTYEVNPDALVNYTAGVRLKFGKF